MRRVAVTGMGMVTALGVGVDANWAAVHVGKSGVATISLFDPEGFDTTIAAEAKAFNPLDHMERKTANRSDRFAQFAITATKEAVAAANLEVNDSNRERIAVMIGSGIGGLGTLSDAVTALNAKGPRRVAPLSVPMFIPNAASGVISIQLGAWGPSYACVSACASSGHAIGESVEMIRRGAIDVAIAGGAEAPIVPVAVAAFASMHALSERNDSPATASRPFDKTRDGFVLGEGAATLVLEAEEVARARGAPILGYVAGYGATTDAYHITAPAERGRGARLAMAAAIKDAGLELNDIQYINAHGTSTELNDRAETQAIKDLFGELAYRIPVSSTKSMTAHTLGAAGAIEAIFSLLAIRHSCLPPTINLHEADPECDLDYVPNEARTALVRHAVSNAFGFGGHNVSLVLSTAE